MWCLHYLTHASWFFTIPICVHKMNCAGMFLKTFGCMALDWGASKMRCMPRSIASSRHGEHCKVWQGHTNWTCWCAVLCYRVTHTIDLVLFLLFIFINKPTFEISLQLALDQKNIMLLWTQFTTYRTLFVKFKIQASLCNSQLIQQNKQHDQIHPLSCSRRCTVGRYHRYHQPSSERGRGGIRWNITRKSGSLLWNRLEYTCHWTTLQEFFPRMCLNFQL